MVDLRHALCVVHPIKVILAFYKSGRVKEDLTVCCAALKFGHCLSVRMTNGGKSTLSKSLHQQIPNSCIIAQDSYFKVRL